MNSLIFDRKFIYLGGLGRPGNGLAPGLEPGRQKEAKQGESLVHFGGDLGHFLVFVRVCCLVYFQVLSFYTLWAVWEPKSSQKVGFGRSFS